MAKVSKTINFIIVFLLITSSAFSCAARVRFTPTDCTVDKGEKQLQDPVERMEKVSPDLGSYPRVEEEVGFIIGLEPFPYPEMIRNAEASLMRMYLRLMKNPKTEPTYQCYPCLLENSEDALLAYIGSDSSFSSKRHVYLRELVVLEPIQKALFD